MTFTEITRVGYGRRLINSIVGAGFGLLLFAGSILLLFWNEGRAVKTARGLEEGAASVISVAAGPVDPAHEGKLVHFSGDASASSLTDPLLKRTATGVSQRNSRPRVSP